MFILIVGCGRVGSSVARAMLREGHEVSCLDEDPESHARLEVGLEKSWEDLGGQFTVGAGLETEALVAAGIERGRRLHRLDRRRQHQHRHRPDRPAPLRGADRDRPHPRPAAGRVVPAPGPAHGLPDPGRDRHAGERRARGRRVATARRTARRRGPRPCTSSSSARARSAGTWPASCSRRTTR